jgi:exonuclease III
MKQYPFDVICMSETWLKDNPLLLQHVNIPGYSSEFRNRDSIKGGGVGAYINESLKYRRRSDIEKKEPSLEHLCSSSPAEINIANYLWGQYIAQKKC